MLFSHRKIGAQLHIIVKMSEIFCNKVYTVEKPDESNRLASSLVRADQKDTGLNTLRGPTQRANWRRETLGVRSSYSGDPDVIISWLSVWQRLCKEQSLACHRQMILFYTHVQYQNQYTWRSSVDRPAKTQASNLLASSLVRVLNSWPGWHEF